MHVAATNDYTDGIAAFVAGLRFEEIPPAVIERIKLLILGMLVQGFELDDVHRVGVLHVGAVTLPALGLGLGRAQTIHALGIAGTQSAGLMAAHFASPPFSNRELEFASVHRGISTAEMLGPITIDATYSPKRFVDANPGVVAAFIAAMDEANAFIAADRRGAAEAFVRVSGVKMSAEQIAGMLADPETGFTTAPKGVMADAEFLAAAGLIKVKAAAWTDLFVPQLHGRVGR